MVIVVRVSGLNPIGILKKDADIIWKKWLSDVVSATVVLGISRIDEVSHPELILGFLSPMVSRLVWYLLFPRTLLSTLAALLARTCKLKELSI